MIDLLPSDDQQQIADAARGLLAEIAPVDDMRAAPGQDERLREGWGELVAFGWFAFGLPEAMGGLAAGLAEEMLLFREAGRALLPPSVLATSLAAHIATKQGHSDLARQLSDGRSRAAFALANAVGEDGDALLIDALSADHVVLIGPDVLALHPLAGEEGRQPLISLDEAVPLERARLTSEPPTISDPLSLDRLALLIAAQQAGIAEASRELAVDYAKLREQFGQPIGAFQAIKHMCADMAVRSEGAVALVSLAALAVAGEEPDARLQLGSAALVAAMAARENAAVCVQVHGGMGFTWECHAHRFVKRAQLWTQLAGGIRTLERAVVADAMPHAQGQRP